MLLFLLFHVSIKSDNFANLLNEYFLFPYLFLWHTSMQNSINVFNL